MDSIWKKITLGWKSSFQMAGSVHFSISKVESIGCLDQVNACSLRKRWTSEDVSTMVVQRQTNWLFVLLQVSTVLRFEDYDAVLKKIAPHVSTYNNLLFFFILPKSSLSNKRFSWTPSDRQNFMKFSMLSLEKKLLLLAFSKHFFDMFGRVWK